MIISAFQFYLISGFHPPKMKNLQIFLDILAHQLPSVQPQNREEEAKRQS